MIPTKLNTLWHEKERKMQISFEFKYGGTCERQPQEFREFTQEEIKNLAEEASQVIPERVRYYAPIIGVDYGRITIRSQKTRWGSCSSKGNLNFNCLLMLTPLEVIDSVVVHELCHRKYMNHSKDFYAEVERVFPDYQKWNKWLKESGLSLIKRLPRKRIAR